MLALSVITMVAALTAQSTPAADLAPSPSASPAVKASPTITASPASTTAPSVKQKLTLDIPAGWRRTESGQYNEWRSPDGRTDFRVAVTGVSSDLHGPNAADTVRAMFQKTITLLRPNAQINVKTVMVCGGTQPAYRVDDPFADGSAAFMMLVPGTKSSGLVTYEMFPGIQPDPGILSAVDKMCWP